MQIVFSKRNEQIAVFLTLKDKETSRRQDRRDKLKSEALKMPFAIIASYNCRPMREREISKESNKKCAI